MPTLYLHIGTSKTGTTAIQHFCRSNKRALASKGFSYPIFPKRYPRVRFQRNGHFLAVYMMDGRKPEKHDEQERMWRARMNYVGRLLRKYPNVILSDEVLWYHTKFSPCDFWERLKGEMERNGCELKVIVYLRRQDLFLSSVYYQKVKADRSYQIPFENFIAAPEDYHAVDYFEQLERIAAVVGRENIIVRAYERARMPGGDVVADFLNILGLRLEDGFHTAEEIDNPTISGDLHQILFAINGLPEQSGLSYSLTRQAAFNCALSGHEPKSSLYSREEAEALLARYEESNRDVARVYCHSEEPLFAPLGDKYPPKWAPSERMYTSLARYFGELSRVQAEWVRNRHRVDKWLARKARSAGSYLQILLDYLLLR